MSELILSSKRQDTDLTYKKSIVFLHTKGKHKKEIGETLLFVKALRKLPWGSPEEVKDFYSENFKTPKKKLRKTLDNRKNSCTCELFDIVE